MSQPILLALALSCISALQAQEAKPYAELVHARLNEAIAATGQLPEKLWKPNPGQGIYMALLHLSENKNVKDAEQTIIDFCVERHAIPGRLHQRTLSTRT